MGMLKGPVPNKFVLGGQRRRKIPDSDSAAQLFHPRAIASTGQTRLDQVQGFGQPLGFSLFHLKQALVQVNVPSSEQLCEARPLCVNLEYPEPKDAMPEGEGCSVWKDDLGRGSSLAGVPLKAGAPFLFLEKQGNIRYVCVNLFFSPAPPDPLPEFESNAHPQEVHAHCLVPGPARDLLLAWTSLMQWLKTGWRLLLSFLFLALIGALSFIVNK